MQDERGRTKEGPYGLDELCKIQERMLRVKDSMEIEYHIGEGRDKVAEVSKKWFQLRDTYGVAIDLGQNDVLPLAITVAIDMMAHAGR